ncbi:MAG: Flp pilus assembly protein CpaB [Bacillota bacterium]
MRLPSGRKRTGLLFLILALLCGFLAAGLVYTVGSRMAPSVPVLVANTEITPGDPLGKEMFREIKLPPAGVPEGIIMPQADLSNTIAAHGMAPGDVLRHSGLIQLETPNPSLLSARLRSLNNPQLRGVEVPPDAAGGLLGGMKTGDRIDIISVSQGTQPGQAQAEQRAATILQSVPVVGVKPPGEGGGGILIVGLTPEQAEIFALAREKGKIYVSLRPFGNAE